MCNMDCCTLESGLSALVRARNKRAFYRLANFEGKFGKMAPVTLGRTDWRTLINPIERVCQNRLRIFLAHTPIIVMIFADSSPTGATAQAHAFSGEDPEGSTARFGTQRMLSMARSIGSPS